MGKPKVGLYWAAGCGGCEESVVDLAEDILTVTGAVDIVFWPVAMDFKYQDVEALKDAELAVVLINGAVRLSEQEHIIKLLRRKSKLVVANGSCACLGGVVGLANFSKGIELINRAYKEVPTVANPLGLTPQSVTREGDKELELPDFYNTVRSLNMVIDVDYYIPGCPSTPELIKDAFMAILQNNLPPKGAVLADTRALCDTCSRRDTKPEKISIREFKRVYEIEIDPTRCFLDQAIICLGLVTRGGCQERCIKANMPCRGCFGALDNVNDQGAKFLSALASMMDSNDEQELKRIVDSIPDPAGLFYRYSLATSLLRGKIDEAKQ